MEKTSEVRDIPYYKEKFIELLKEAENTLGSPLKVSVGSRVVETGTASSASSYLWGTDKKREYGCSIHADAAFYI